MTAAHHHLHRTIGRAFLVLTAIGVGLAMLVGVLVLGIQLSKGTTGQGGYTFAVRYVAPGAKSEPITQPIRATNGEAFVQYESILVTTHEDLAEPILLTRLALVAPFVVFYLGCALVLVLIRRVWTARSFTRPAALGLAVLGALVIAVATFVPWLELRAVDLAVQQLGLPVAPTGAEPASSGWVVPQPYGLESIDWPLVVLGVVLVFLAVLLHRGMRLQADVDGLV